LNIKKDPKKIKVWYDGHFLPHEFKLSDIEDAFANTYRVLVDFTEHGNEEEDS